MRNDRYGLWPKNTRWHREDNRLIPREDRPCWRCLLLESSAVFAAGAALGYTLSKVAGWACNAL